MFKFYDSPLANTDLMKLLQYEFYGHAQVPLDSHVQMILWFLWFRISN